MRPQLTPLLNCMVTKPPLVVFVTGIFAFAVTSFLLAVTISNRDSVRDPDAFDWDTFFLKISRLEYCVHTGSAEETGDAAIAGDGGAKNGTGSVSLLVPIATRFLRDFHSTTGGAKNKDVIARGNVLMDHLDRGRLAKYRGMNVTLTLSLPAASAYEDDVDREDACVGLLAPEFLLADLNSGKAPDGCTLPSPADASVRALSFETHTADHLPPDWCSRNGSVAMELSYEERPEWVVHLSRADQRLVSLHLLCTSIFLFALGMLAALVAACRGIVRHAAASAAAGASTSAGVNMQPTTAAAATANMSKNVGDGRGDMQLLPQDE